MAETIHTKVAGVTFENDNGHKRQDLIRDLVKSGDNIDLDREKGNSFDPNAIAVLYFVEDKKEWEYGYHRIGYISRDLAAQLAPLLDQGYEIHAEVAEVTGEEYDSLGVNLELTVYTTEEVKRIHGEGYIGAQAQIDEIKKYMEVTRINQQQAEKKAAHPPEPIPQKKSPSYIDSRAPKKSSRNWLVTLFLCVFLGYFGAHQFYAGKKGLGVLYIFTLGLFMIGWLVDIVLILIGKFKDSNGLLIKL